jgi:3',5'-cyclic AMP phosphodiesterase CpdA
LKSADEMRFKFRIPLLMLSLSCFLLLFGCAGTPVHDASFEGDLSSRQSDSTFVLLGDPQRTSFWELLVFREQNDGVHQELFDEIARENPGLVLLLGDLVSQGDDDREWVKFDDFTASVRQRHIPIYAVLGNHDYFGDKQDALGNFFERFPHQQKRLWNSFRFRSVAFILLNSNIAQMTSRQVDEQEKWYEEQLAADQADSSVTVIVVACHHPPFTNSTIVSDNKDVLKDFVGPYLQTAKAKLFVTGHCHSYEHFVKDGKHFLVTGGGGGPRQSVSCDEKQWRHPDLYKGDPIRAFHFCRVTIESDGLNVEMVRLNPSKDTWEVGNEFRVPTRVLTAEAQLTSP